MKAFGIFNALARCITGKRADGEMIQVALTPTLCHWDYVPIDGTCTLVHRDIDFDNGAWFRLDTHKRIADAMADFITYCRPLTNDQTAMVIDQHGVIILGWHWEGDELVWMGCEVVFNGLAQGWDEMEVGMWAQNAHEAYLEAAPFREYTNGS